jgi:hypothetical protein
MKFMLLLACLLFFSIPIQLGKFGLELDPHEANALWIDPPDMALNNIENEIGDKFNMTLWLNLTTMCKGWQINLLYRKDILGVLRVGYTAGAKSEFFQNITTIPVSPVFRSYNDTHEALLYGEAWIMGPARGPGYGSLAWVEFNVTATPPPEEEFSTTIDISTHYPFKTFALDENDEKITLATYDCHYDFSWIPPNLAILDVVPERTLVSQGRDLNITVTIENLGFEVNLINITAYANDTVIQTKSIQISSGDNASVVFVWNTLASAIGKYTISAYVDPHPDEENIADNNFINGMVEVAILPYDINGDGYVGIDDIVMVADYFGTQPSHPRWNPMCDVTDDDYVGIDDVVEVALHFGEIV